MSIILSEDTFYFAFHGGATYNMVLQSIISQEGEIIEAEKETVSIFIYINFS